MKILISRDGEHLSNAEAERLGDVPDLLFAAAKHCGGGEFIARAGSDSSVPAFPPNEPLVKLTLEYLEGAS